MEAPERAKQQQSSVTGGGGEHSQWPGGGGSGKERNSSLGACAGPCWERGVQLGWESAAVSPSRFAPCLTALRGPSARLQASLLPRRDQGFSLPFLASSA